MLIRFAGDADIFPPKSVDMALRWKTRPQRPSGQNAFLSKAQLIRRMYSFCTDIPSW